MERKPEAPQFDAVEVTDRIEALQSMIERLLTGTFSEAFDLSLEDQALMVEALYTEVGRLSASFIRARVRAKR
ncbi:hypothetical protein AB0J01_28240 [Streptomyces sp. NPDC050204]|uniref:hypothetical protein n=1 Tax=Streptomyces sp. NPDC050204 TaxID=3155514 RepID=UPI00342C732C